MNTGTCIHFNGGFHNKCCKVGVNYHDAFDGKKPGIFLRMPCIQFYVKPTHGKGTYAKAGEEEIHEPIDRKGEVVIPCALLQLPTPEQVQQDRREMDAHWEKTMVALKVASEWRVKPKPKQDRQEVIECPVCKGKLHLSQSSYNGHVHGQCETQGCVSWME